MFSITFGCEQGWGQCFPMPWFPHRASRHLQHNPLLLPSTPACQSNSALLVQSPSSQHATYRLWGSQTLPRCPSRWLHKGRKMIPWVSQWTWPDQVNPTLWYLVYDWRSHPVFPKSHQQAAWCIEIPCQLSGMEQPQYDFTHSRLLQQTHSRAWGEKGALWSQNMEETGGNLTCHLIPHLWPWWTWNLSPCMGN